MPSKHTTPQDIPLKRCTKCGVLKPTTSEYFCRDRSKKDGFYSSCNQCRASQARDYYEANKERYTARGKVYYKANRVHIDKRIKAYRAANSARTRERAREYRMAHLQRVRERERVWTKDNLDRVRKNQRAWLEANREHVNERYRAKHRANPEILKAKNDRRRARKCNAKGSHTAEDIQVQYKAQRGRCYYCHKKVGDDYHVDHVIPLSRGGSDGPENIVIACPTCNLRKNDKLPSEWPEGGKLL